jgi:Mor family transcriptional regulator
MEPKPELRPDMNLADLPAAALLPLERLFADDYPPVWREICTHLYVELRVTDAVNGMAEETTARLALAQTERLRRELGGQQPYLPRGANIGMSERDRKIGEQLHGGNLRELAHRYGLTESRIRQIHAQWLAEQVRDRQGTLSLG